jgi:hypothetical protein
MQPGLIEIAGEAHAAVCRKAEPKPSMFRQGLSAASGVAMAPVNFVAGKCAAAKAKYTDNKEAIHGFARTNGVDLVAYTVAANVNVLNKSEKVRNGMLRVFNTEEQANLALFSALAQGLNKVYSIYDAKRVVLLDKDYKATKLKKTLAVVQAVVRDFAKNILVSEVKDKATTYVVNPIVAKVQDKYGVNLQGKKLVNVGFDAASWVVLRRVDERATSAISEASAYCKSLISSRS